MEILVDNKVDKVFHSEKILGVIISNDLTWYDHLHVQNSPGLIPQISQNEQEC